MIAGAGAESLLLLFTMEVLAARDVRGLFVVGLFAIFIEIAAAYRWRDPSTLRTRIVPNLGRLLTMSLSA